MTVASELVYPGWMTIKKNPEVKRIQSMGGDSMVVAAALVSTNGTQAHELSFAGKYCSPEKQYGLINYLMKHRHGTPFEHSGITFFVHTPIFVWREWMRHRIGFSYNEESGRYKQLEPIFYIPPRGRPMMKPAEDWKPGRPKFLPCTDDALYHNFVHRKIKQYESAYQSYEQSLKEGFDPGLARIDLPVGIFSGCYVTCNPRSCMAFLSLRTHDESAKFVSYPLYEIEVAARLVEDIFSQGWPLTYKAFCENGRVGP